MLNSDPLLLLEQDMQDMQDTKSLLMPSNF